MFGLLEHLERPAANRPLASSDGPVAVRNDGTSEDDRRNDGRSEAVARNVVTIEDGEPAADRGRSVLTASGESGANIFSNPLPRRDTVPGAGIPRGHSSFP